ncbi:hypothetical protein [Sphingomonas endophytica]|uniref:Uncharacterized protein n=1 Tax=Sphingomonas endophytica TaxID=869719 RepID=A0A147HWE3_9SPHN|nr:hypothetical protein [Sphingomonas endophytica]KTT69185.1 hypothetical protein NS334_15155 [Sphingomonas endophytica]
MENTTRDAVKHWFRRVFFAFLGIAAFDALGITLENVARIPFDTTYKITCAGVCLLFVAKCIQEYPDQRWPRIAFGLAAAINMLLLVTILADEPASRGEIVLFALPDVAIVMALRAISYPVSNEHERAVRQQLIVGAILAAFVSLLLLGTAFIPDRRPDRSTTHVTLPRN